MRRVQAAALDLFETRGWEGVTVDEIASAAGVGPATVYRNFGTKERVVLWDEYDPLLLEAIRARLGHAPLLEVIESALVATLDTVYSEDRDRILRRARLTLTTPSLLAASEPDRASLRAALAALFLEKRARHDPLAADVAAAATVATLEIAVVHWVRAAGRTPMREVLSAAFRALARLG